MNLDDVRLTVAKTLSHRLLRKILDNDAVYVYKHWVKRGDGQNMAAFFDNNPNGPRSAATTKKKRKKKRGKEEAEDKSEAEERNRLETKKADGDKWRPQKK